MGQNATTQTRRSFLDLILGSSLFLLLASIFYPVGKYLVPPHIEGPNVNSVDVGPLSDFPKGFSKVVRFGRKPVIVFRQKNGDIKALAATCTHLDCTVQFKKETEQIWCACHNGVYSVQGTNISGPPPRPLAQYQVNIKAENIIVTKGDMA